AADTGRSCGPAPAWSYADGDRAPLSPSASSASSRDDGRSCTPRRPAGLATFANRRKETPDAAGRDVASPPGRSPTPDVAGSRHCHGWWHGVTTAITTIK